MWNWLTKLLRPSQVNAGGRLLRRRSLRARYDAAATTADNRRHWVNADGLSANAANNPEVRCTLRNRARYEVANNSYARGIVLTLANDVVGTGPRLQMVTRDAEANRIVEREFGRWSAAVGLPEKLRTMRMARASDGEAFAILTSNEGSPSPINLDLRLVEAEQVCTPDLSPSQLNAVDGIVFDAFGNPVVYHVLKEHPGSDRFVVNSLAYDPYPAASVIHYFRCDRPGQARGIPDITPALPLFAQLRRFTLAVLAAAETAADFAGILYTDAPAGGEAEAAEPFEPIELEKRALLTMPGGWKMAQMHAEQPSTGYTEFKKEILNEIARCLNMPFKEGVQEAVLLLTTRIPRSCRQSAALFGVTQHHRVFRACGTTAANDQQVGIELGLAECLPQFRERLPHALAGLFEPVVVRIHLAIGFKSVDRPLHLGERASPADGRGEQPEQAADLAVLTEVDAFAHAPRESRVVLVAADADILWWRSLLSFRRCIAALDRRLASSDLETQRLPLGPGDGPVVNLHDCHRPRLFLCEPRQCLPVLQILGRVESVRREVGLHLPLRLLNFLGQLRECFLLLGPQGGKIGLDQPPLLVGHFLQGAVEGGKKAAKRFQHLAMRHAHRLDPRRERPQTQRGLCQRLLGLRIVGDGGHKRLARSDRSFFPVLVHVDGGNRWSFAKRRHSTAPPSTPTFPPPMPVP